MSLLLPRRYGVFGDVHHRFQETIRQAFSSTLVLLISKLNEKKCDGIDNIFLIKFYAIGRRCSRNKKFIIFVTTFNPEGT